MEVCFTCVLFISKNVTLYIPADKTKKRNELVEKFKSPSPNAFKKSERHISSISINLGLPNLCLDL